MRLLTCGDSAYYTFLNALLKSNRDTDKLPVTLVDWGLQDDQLNELSRISKFDHVQIQFPREERMLSKVVAIRDTLEQKQEAILYLDGDFIFTSSIEDDLSRVRDVAVTWLDFRTEHPDVEGHSMWLNAGFFFCQHTDKSLMFVNRWLDGARANPDWWGDQDVLSDMTRPHFPLGQSPLAHITYLPCTVYNCVPDSPFDEAKLIHMKGKWWHEIVTGKVEFPSARRPERLRPVYEKWKEIRYS